MINKQSLWFLTLFSLILVLSVYYITMPNELLLTNNSNYTNTDTTSNEVNTEVVVEESELLVTMRVNLEEERQSTIDELKTTLTSEDATSEEKNDAYEQIKYITNLEPQEQVLEEKIKENYNLDCFIKIDNDEIKVVAVKEEHDVALANNIMKTIQEEFEEKVYITVKFEK